MATSYKVEIKFPEDSSVEWIRLAAYIDGEGHIEITSKDNGARGNCLKLSVGNTDPRLCMWLQSTFGGSVRRRSVTKGWKVFWDWRVNGRNAAAILVKCLPHFIMKSDQAEVAIAFGNLVERNHQVGRGRGRGKGWDHPSIAPEIYQERTALMLKLRDVRENSCERVN
jgi:hypothetical protein